MDGPIYALEFRRMQIHEQQTEKQKKNPLQKTLVFSKRAVELKLVDSWIQSLDTKFRIFPVFKLIVFFWSFN